MHMLQVCWLLKASTRDKAIWWTKERAKELRYKDSFTNHGNDSISFQDIFYKGDAVWLEAEISQLKFPCRLALANKLPEELVRLPWETIMVGEKELRNRFVIERYAPIPFIENNPSVQKGLVISLLMDQDEYLKVEKIRQENDFRHIRNKGMMDAFFCKSYSPGMYSYLCIIAHGNENSEDVPWEAGWQFPANKDVPPVVLLLVCGNKQGELVEYGKKLIDDKGAKIVLVGVGKLHINVACEFFQFFDKFWKQGLCIASIVNKAKTDLPSESWKFLNLMRILGQGDIRIADTDPKSFEEDTNSNLNLKIEIVDKLRKEPGKGNLNYALKELINRITFECYYENGSLCEASYRLYDQLGIVLYDKDRETELVVDLSGIEQLLWSTSQKWVQPLLTLLSKRWNIPLINTFKDGTTPSELELPTRDSLLFKDYTSKTPLDQLVKGLTEKQVAMTTEQWEFYKTECFLDERNRRIIINGVAGSGKTCIAIKLAEELAAQDKSVLFLCFNVDLKSFVAKELSDTKVRTVQNFDGLVHWRVNVVDQKKTPFNLDPLPKANKLLEYLEKKPVKYDVIIVDEGNDFFPSWFEAIEQLGAKDYRFFCFYDSNQIIYLPDSHWKEPAGTHFYTWNKNLRNGKLTGDYACKLGGFADKMRESIDYKAAQQYIEEKPMCKEFDSLNEMAKKLDDEISNLIEEGVSVDDIVVLSPFNWTEKKNHLKTCIVEWKAITSYKYVERNAKEQNIIKRKNSIYISTIHSFKGMESNHVFLVDISIECKNIEKLLYIGVTRARYRAYLFHFSNFTENIKKLDL